jgi:hypothetical protein
MIVLLEKLDIFQKKTPRETFRDGMFGWCTFSKNDKGYTDHNPRRYAINICRY